MLQQHQVSLLPAERQGDEVMIPQKRVVTVLVVICVTLLVFTWITRKSLCEIRISNGDTEVAAVMACESVG